MRRKACMLFIATLGALASLPVLAEPPAVTAPAEARPPRATPASPAELERYREREQQTTELEKFEGGRRGTIAVTTVIIILLVVLLIVIIV